MPSLPCLPIHDGTCVNFSTVQLSLPTPLKPIISNLPLPSCWELLFSPLCILGATLFVTSLLASHKLSRTPLSELGHVGARGRKHFSWNESTGGGGGIGGSFLDYWFYGGSVWIRVGQFLWDGMFGHADEEGEASDQNVGGENLFACFGVTKSSGSDDASASNARERNETKPNTQQKRIGTGIIGYDSSLGSHGPLISALLRSSIMLLSWCSTISFMVRTHGEIKLYLTKVDTEASGVLYEAFLKGIVFLLQTIESILNAGESNQAHSDNCHGILFTTIIYASAYIALLEVTLFVLGKMFAFFRIYDPKGVSHPGGPRQHKILRIPKWTKDQQHTLPKELIQHEGSTWRCAVAHDAHNDTIEKFSGIASSDGDGKGGANVADFLTGEPFGRQIWTLEAKQCRNANEDTEDGLEGNLRKEFINASENSRTSQIEADYSDLIQELASGGRSPLAFDPSKNPNSCDQLFRAQMILSYLERNGGKLPKDIAYLQNHKQKSDDKGQTTSDSNAPKTVIEAAKRGIAFYSLLQTPDGHWAGDYGGPHFLLPGLVVAWYVMGCPSVMISPPQQALMLHYLKVHQQEDGGWGTHIESPSTMFGTVICYLAVRLLGAKHDEDWIVKGRDFIQKEGGAVMTSSWAKFWLCLVGCMEWTGHNSVPPEMWLLPNWFPFHPGRLWCHCRMVYLPMGYLYGSRFVYSNAESDPLIAKLREELYCQAYESIDWDKTRHLVAPMDNYSPIPTFMKFAQNCLSIYENWTFFRPIKNAMRKAGLEFCLEYMRAEDLQTNYIDIGPVNKALNMVSAFHAANHDINDVAVRSHMMRVPDYLWIAEDGMKMQGYNGSQCWDTSFAIQAVWECGMLDKFPLLSSKVWAYLERCQILSTETSRSSPAFKYESCDNRDKFYRHVSKGGWPFSTSAHGWPISDCTGEGLKGVLALMDSPIVMKAVKKGILKNIEPSRLYDAVNVILTLQNEDGGWATYENNRGFGWYEELNPSEVFGDIMIDYSYVECSMASMTALVEFHEKFPNHRTREIKFAIHRGKEFMKSIQREDGSWYGSWACCFCYGCWFGIEGLIKAGESPSSPAIQKCCEFLLSHQRENGGWGEDFTSCYDKDYAAHGMQSYGDGGSGVVNTAWALMALSAAKCKDVEAIKRGVKYLMKRQLDCGDWPQEGISGVFNRACGITYTAYRNVFPIWALGRCAATYGCVLDRD
mmetsp:Transcript_20255/g.41423  ORF Transcript_20255/g.41423 Transcript_20255/m.41423 type:complete len:1203 (+) Transcript_20255:239-3847(+)